MKIHSRLEHSYAVCRKQLLASKNDQQHWEGELSASALSTATALMAMHQVSLHNRQLAGQFPLQQLIATGLAWLVASRNEDGGWGDTTKSFSNISTTMLVRAIFAATAGKYGATSEFSADWLDVTDRYIEKIGGVAAVKKRYGKDRTFSVPILMQCALAGTVRWSQVSQLPFELSCLPANWYKWAQLPVVSYALPALIAIGLLKHRKQPTWFLHWRWLRNFAATTSLKVLERIQPPTGGYLEATPLTSFVTMSLCGAGEAEHPVVKNAIRFLVESVCEDGSWPIDTNLATWVTTLSINAMKDDLPEEQVTPLLDWLLDQQYKKVHPFTNADPGGWAWTDLSGGVPDADDTPGAILAILKLKQRVADERHAEVDLAVQHGVRWLLSLQNRDGGWPTFCKGWGKLPFDRSSPDITAHVLRALNKSSCLVDSGIYGERVFSTDAMKRGFRFLKKQQRADGAWLPLWFGNQFANEDENPVYGTARVLLAYIDTGQANCPEAVAAHRFLCSIQNEDGGWGGAVDTPSSIEETSLALETLSQMQTDKDQIERAALWLCKRVDAGHLSDPTPIGFYFAKLWYYEKMYPLVFATAALRHLQNM